MAERQTSSVRAFILDQHDRVLLLMRQDMPFWCMPGGGIEDGETSYEAICREISEELPGLDVTYLYKIGSYIKTGGKIIDTSDSFAFRCTILPSTTIVQPQDEEIYWECFSQNNIPANTYPSHIKRIHDGFLGCCGITHSYPEINVKSEMKLLQLDRYYKLQDWSNHPSVLKNRTENKLYFWPFLEEAA